MFLSIAYFKNCSVLLLQDSRVSQVWAQDCVRTSRGHAARKRSNVWNVQRETSHKMQAGALDVSLVRIPLDLSAVSAYFRYFNIFRYRLRRFSSSFRGCELVSWLVESRLCLDRSDAVTYASTLMEGRILEHVQQKHYFYDLPYLYQFVDWC